MTCEREDELLDALARGFVGAELESHAASCTSCLELRTVAGAVLEDRSHAIAEAAIPNAGTMWWRMQVRHRQEVQSAARRSLLIGQAATIVIAFALIYAFFGTELVGGMREWITALRINTPLLIVLATWIVAAPIGGYLAIRQK
jgi:hypothetical protein